VLLIFLEKNHPLEKQQLLEVGSAATLEVLRRLRTKIFQTENTQERQYLLACCEQIAHSCAEQLVRLVASPGDVAPLIKNFTVQLRKTTDNFKLESLPVTTAHSDSLVNRQMNMMLEDVIAVLRGGSIKDGLSPWLSDRNVCNGVGPQELSQSHALIVAPLSSGLLLANIWNQIFLQGRITTQPMNIQTVAWSVETLEVAAHSRSPQFRQIYILDDTVSNRYGGVVGATDRLYRQIYKGTGTKIKSAINPISTPA
jgi:hypothetical protein